MTVFEYTLRDESSIKCITMKGRIDGLSSAGIQKIFDELILAGHRALLVDMTSVNYVSSAGLRVFMSAQKELKKVRGEIILSGIADQVFEIFKMSGFTQFFRIIKAPGEISQLFQSGPEETGVTAKHIGEILIEYVERRVKRGSLISVGSQNKTETSSFTEGDVIAVKPSEMQFGCGLAALGDVWEEYKNLFGESMVVNNSFFFYPAVKHSSVDFVINAHRDPGITYKVLHGFGFSGDYRYVLAFRHPENGSVDLASMIECFFALSEADILGLSIVAESKGLLGMHIKRVPIIENKPANNKSVFDGENFPLWIDFPVEPSYVNHVVVATGIAVRDRGSLDREKRSLVSQESPFHIHGGIFDAAPIGNDVNEFDNEIMRIFNELSLHKIQHILGQSRFSGGMAAIVEIER
jgi:anti-anti-sigma factor